MEEEQKNGWAIWVILPVCVVATVLVTRWLIKSNTGPAALTEEYSAVERPVTDDDGDEQAQPEPGEVRARYDSAGVKAQQPATPAADEPKTAQADAGKAAADGRTVKKQRSFGAARDAISNFVAKSLDNPKAVAALLNNQYVVDGFMSRATVKAATASPKALSNYLKNPANLSKFMSKAAVKNGVNDGAMVDAVASSKLVGAMLETPGGRGLLDDPQALADIFMANPALASAISNPNILTALMNNPRTAGLVDTIAAGGSR